MNGFLLVGILTSFVYLLIHLVEYKSDNESNTNSQQITEQYLTNSGNYVRSYGEKAIADFLDHAGIKFIYELTMLGMKPDFYLPEYGLVIEYFGLAYNRNELGFSYRKKMKYKLKKYTKHKQIVLALFPDDISSKEFQDKIITMLNSMEIQN